jgi:hypothetical protein
MRRLAARQRAAPGIARQSRTARRYRLPPARAGPISREILEPCAHARDREPEVVGNPQVDLKLTIALAPELSDPVCDPVGGCGQRPEPAHAAFICHRTCEAGGAGAGHRRLQYWHPQAETSAESGGALSHTRCIAPTGIVGPSITLNSADSDAATPTGGRRLFGAGDYGLGYHSRSLDRRRARLADEFRYALQCR